MVRCVFLDWNRPLCDTVADWLLSHREEMHGACVIVPTAQSGRRLRIRMREQDPQCTLPECVTPSQWLGKAAAGSAPDWMESLAWCMVIDAIDDWAPYGALFPEEPDVPLGSLHPLAGKLRHLALRLQENGHTFGSAAKAMAQSPDSARWHCLAALEQRFVSLLAQWGHSSRSGILATRDHGFLTHRSYVLAGIPDMPPWLARHLASTAATVTALVGAPEPMADLFDDIGLPLESWSQEILPWPQSEMGSVQLAADGAAQIHTMITLLADAGTSSDQAVIGTADSALARGLAEALTQNGWTAFDPSPSTTVTGLRRWWHAWRAWLVEESVAHLHDLLLLPESVCFGSAPSIFAALETLGKLRDQRLIRTMEDLHRTPKPTHGRGPDPETIQTLATAASERRAWFLSTPFPEAVRTLLTLVGGQDPDVEFLIDWCQQIEGHQDHTRRSHGFWLDLMIDSLPPIPPAPPEGRVADVLGWLELPYASGAHLLVCGMNEGKVPAAIANDPWLGEKASQRLGLPTQARRAARDAFLARQLGESRRDHGRVDWICGKFGTGGTALLPSRILLQSESEELAKRVQVLFRDIPPVEAGIRKCADWKWTPRTQAQIERVSVTALRDWIECPFRFYLKHIARVQPSEHDRIEWDHRDFGNVFHDVVEAWANDEEARDFSKADALGAWLSARLDRIVAGRFGKTPSLAIRMQTESLRSRLHWFARQQAVLRAEGWRTIAAERKMEMTLGGVTISGKIDRIDSHPDHGLRVVDYKTSAKAKPVVQEHLVGLTAQTRHLMHWGIDSPLYLTDQEKEYRWKNLQLPLYAAWLQQERGTLPTPCYIGIGASEKEVKVLAWEAFSQAHLDSAVACAAWIIENLRNAVFWPPAGKAPYQDDVASALACGWPEDSMFELASI